MGAFDFFKKKMPEDDRSAEMKSISDQIASKVSENVNMEESIPAPPSGNLDMVLDDESKNEVPKDLMPLEPETAIEQEDFEIDTPDIEEPRTEDFASSSEDSEAPQQEFDEPQAPVTLRTIKGPVFISLKKYKELRTELDTLKFGSNELKNILKSLKENRDSGFDLLDKATDQLLRLENEAEKVNKLMKN